MTHPCVTNTSSEYAVQMLVQKRKENPAKIIPPTPGLLNRFTNLVSDGVTSVKNYAEENPFRFTCIVVGLIGVVLTGVGGIVGSAILVTIGLSIFAAVNVHAWIEAGRSTRCHQSDDDIPPSAPSVEIELDDSHHVERQPEPHAPSAESTGLNLEPENLHPAILIRLPSESDIRF